MRDSRRAVAVVRKPGKLSSNRAKSRLQDATRPLIDALESRVLLAAPANDAFASAIALSGMSGQTTGSNVDATQEAQEGRASVWWTWTPTSSGIEDMNTTGSNFDTVLTVFTGTSLSALTVVATNDDNGTSGTSALSFNAVSGQVYHICVAGFANGMGAIDLNWVLHGPTGLTLSRTQVSEDQPAGTEVGTFSTVDATTSSGFTYSLVAGTGSADNQSFVVDGNRLRTAEMFSYEAKNVYSVLVRVKDPEGLTFEKSFTVNVTNVVEVAAPWSIQGTPDNDVITLDRDGAEYVLTINGNETGKVADLVRSIAISGLGGNDTIVLSSTVTLGCWVSGGSGNDTVVGGPGADSIIGNSGADVIDGRSGADSIVGGSGNDVIRGGPGDDTIIGGAGHDTIRAGTGSDWIYVDEGPVSPVSDTVYTGDGTNHVDRDSSDIIYGSYVDILG